MTTMHHPQSFDAPHIAAECCNIHPITTNCEQTGCKPSTNHRPSTNADDTKSGEGSKCHTVNRYSCGIDDTSILLDWDDTLFPTSMIVDVLRTTDRNGFSLVPDFQIELLNTLGTLTLSLLKKLIHKYGAKNIHIVTNSLNGWIKDSLQYASCIANVYTHIQKLLIDHNITMESAQTIYAEKLEGSTPLEWKRLCFDGILNGNNTAYSHIISIGDQWTDHISVKQSIQLSEYTCAPLHHVIKLKTQPSLEDLVNEMMYVQTCFDAFFSVTELRKPVIVDYHREEINYRIKEYV